MEGMFTLSCVAEVGQVTSKIVSVLLGHLFQSFFFFWIEGKDFSWVALSVPIESFRLKISKAPFLGYMGCNKETQGTLPLCYPSSSKFPT